MKTHFAGLFIPVVLSLFVISCSSGVMNPITPDSSQPEVSTPQTVEVVPVSKNLWGYWDISIDPTSGEVDIIPVRGVEFCANVTMFLQPPQGKITNLGILVTDLSEFSTQGLIDVEVTLTHPFPGLDQFTGFDVMGVFIHDGDELGKYDTDVFYGISSEVARLLNADGLTRWYNPTEFTDTGLLGFTEGALGTPGVTFSATVNGYKYFADGLGADEDLTDFLKSTGIIEKRAYFSSTGSNSRLFKLQFPMFGSEPLLIFQYAVVANWEMPANIPPDIPDDFPENANAAEPFHLDITDNGSDLFYFDGSGGGTVRVTAELFDWQAGSNPNGILGEFSRIVIESPNANITGFYLEYFPDDFIGYVNPGTAISSTAYLEFTGVEPTSLDDVEFLLTIEGKAGELYDQGFGVPVPDDPLASYWYFTIPVEESNCGGFSVTGAIPSPGESGSFYPDFEVQGVNFQDGPNLAVDIVDGTDVVAGATSVVWTDINTIDCAFDFCGVNPGDYDLRVTNGCDPISYATMAYTIDPDPLKNMDIRPGFTIRDLGIRETTGEAYVLFSDGQLWIYEADYANGVYMNANGALDYVDTLDNGDTCMGDATGSGQTVYRLAGNYFMYWGYSGTMMDVTETDLPGFGDRAYFWQNGGSYILSTRRTPVGYGGNLTAFMFVGSGPGLVNLSAFKALHSSKQNPNPTMALWLYALEGSPEFAIERYDYYAVSGSHAAYHDLTICGTQGDGEDQLNSPLDISGDFDDNIYVLDILSTSQPVVKVYDMDGVYLGEFGDNVSISGTPLRLDVDEGDGEVHVTHTNGVSVFRPCEIPI